MSTAILGNPQLYQSDDIVYGYATGTGNIITKGDWVQYSGGYIVGWGTQATPAYRYSGVGIALDNNPKYDPLGRAVENSALPVLTHGVIRVSASAASLTGLPSLGAGMAPLSTASGIVGTTGATGLGAVWGHVAAIGVTATGTVVASGVGKVIGIITAGNWTAAQVDVLFDARQNFGIV